MQNRDGERTRHYVPPMKFGLGGVSLGNEFEVVTDEAAYRTLDAAWTAGVRYYDVSPWYGLGLAERRFGSYLHNKNRDEYVLSSKVGKLLKASKQNSGSRVSPSHRLQTTSYSTTRPTACAAPLRTVCSGLASAT